MKIVINLPKRNHPDYIKIYNRKNYERQVLHQARCRAKRDGLAFNITKEDIIIPDICPVLNIPIKINYGSGWHDDSPSLDRIHNDLGYIKGNVRVISNRANRIKMDATLEELELVYLDACHIRSGSQWFTQPYKDLVHHM